VDDGNYDNGTFLDRDYDIRDKKNISINLENIGANAVKYKILSTPKHFTDLDADISDDDFDKEEKAETSLNPRSKATGSVTLDTGASGSVDGITVDGVQIMSGSVPFNTSLDQTATDVAANINAFTSNPKYTAVAVGAVITISATVNEPSTAVVVSTVTTITKTDANMSGGAAGKADTLEIAKSSPSITAIRLRAKESAAGSPGKIRADIKCQ